MRGAGATLLGIVVLAALAAPWLAPHEPGRQFRDSLLAPPMPVRFVDARGGLRAPFVYPIRLADRIERRYEEDRTRRVRLVWLAGGRLVTTADTAVPWFPLGTDALGRDVLSRLLEGARPSLGVAVTATMLALLIGALLGGLAGQAGGLPDAVLMRLAEGVLVLPVLYVVLALRTALPLVLPPATLFVGLTLVLAAVGWPGVARGVRGIVAVEARREYADAAHALGAGRARVLLRHLLPATGSFLATQALLLVPAFVLAEATLSYIGLGFAPPLASWGSMLQEAANVRAIADFPWVLSPAVAIALVVLGLNLVLEDRTDGA